MILEAKNLHVQRAQAILLDVPWLGIEEGEVLSLIGPNGAGKTTFLQTLCYLTKPFEGEVFFKGLKVNDAYPLSQYRRKVAMVFQEPLLFNTTVYENVASGLKFRGMNRSEVRAIVTENLERFGIAHLKDRSARTLSGGEAQRTSLARALATGPDILFLDEPFASLDPPTREALLEDFERILKHARITAVLATHDRDEAVRLSHRMGVMNLGRILQIGSPEEVLNHPVDEFVASFVGVETILSGEVIHVGAGSFTASVQGREIEAVGRVRPGEGVILCIRPESVTLSSDSFGSNVSARNIFRGDIQRIVHLGLYYKIYLDCGFPLVAYVTHGSLKRLSLKEGQEVEASFKATAVHVLRKTGGLEANKTLDYPPILE